MLTCCRQTICDLKSYPLYNRIAQGVCFPTKGIFLYWNLLPFYNQLELWLIAPFQKISQRFFPFTIHEPR